MKKKDTEGTSFCQLDIKKGKTIKKNRSAFYEHEGNLKWDGIENEPYKTQGDEWSRIVRRVLIGSHGESTKFHVRYFEIFPGGNSSLEKHKHEHVVICVKGIGILRYGRTKRRMGFMDVAYISPDTVHQLSNPFEETFGFLCIVNAKRDKPRMLKG